MILGDCVIARDWLAKADGCVRVKRHRLIDGEEAFLEHVWICVSRDIMQGVWREVAMPQRVDLERMGLGR